MTLGGEEMAANQHQHQHRKSSRPAGRAGGDDGVDLRGSQTMLENVQSLSEDRKIQNYQLGQQEDWAPLWQASLSIMQGNNDAKPAPPAAGAGRRSRNRQANAGKKRAGRHVRARRHTNSATANPVEKADGREVFPSRPDTSPMRHRPQHPHDGSTTQHTAQRLEAEAAEEKMLHEISMLPYQKQLYYQEQFERLKALEGELNTITSANERDRQAVEGQHKVLPNLVGASAVTRGSKLHVRPDNGIGLILEKIGVAIDQNMWHKHLRRLKNQQLHLGPTELRDQLFQDLKLRLSGHEVRMVIKGLQVNNNNMVDYYELLERSYFTASTESSIVPAGRGSRPRRLKRSPTGRASAQTNKGAPSIDRRDSGGNGPKRPAYKRSDSGFSVPEDFEDVRMRAIMVKLGEGAQRLFSCSHLEPHFILPDDWRHQKKLLLPTPEFREVVAQRVAHLSSVEFALLEKRYLHSKTGRINWYPFLKKLRTLADEKHHERRKGERQQQFIDALSHPTAHPHMSPAHGSEGSPSKELSQGVTDPSEMLPHVTDSNSAWLLRAAGHKASGAAWDVQRPREVQAAQKVRMPEPIPDDSNLLRVSEAKTRLEREEEEQRSREQKPRRMPKPIDEHSSLLKGTDKVYVKEQPRRLRIPPPIDENSSLLRGTDKILVEEKPKTPPIKQPAPITETSSLLRPTRSSIIREEAESSSKVRDARKLRQRRNAKRLARKKEREAEETQLDSDLSNASASAAASGTPNTKESDAGTPQSKVGAGDNAFAAEATVSATDSPASTVSPNVSPAKSNEGGASPQKTDHPSSAQQQQQQQDGSPSAAAPDSAREERPETLADSDLEQPGASKAASASQSAIAIADTDDTNQSTENGGTAAEDGPTAEDVDDNGEEAVIGATQAEEDDEDDDEYGDYSDRFEDDEFEDEEEDDDDMKAILNAVAADGNGGASDCSGEEPPAEPAHSETTADTGGDGDGGGGDDTAKSSTLDKPGISAAAPTKSPTDASQGHHSDSHDDLDYEDDALFDDDDEADFAGLGLEEHSAAAHDDGNKPSIADTSEDEGNGSAKEVVPNAAAKKPTEQSAKDIDLGTSADLEADLGFGSDDDDMDDLGLSADPGGESPRGEADLNGAAAAAPSGTSDGGDGNDDNDDDDDDDNYEDDAAFDELGDFDDLDDEDLDGILA